MWNDKPNSLQPRFHHILRGLRAWGMHIFSQCEIHQFARAQHRRNPRHRARWWSQASAFAIVRSVRWVANMLNNSGRRFLRWDSASGNMVWFEIESGISFICSLLKQMKQRLE